MKKNVVLDLSHAQVMRASFPQISLMKIGCAVGMILSSLGPGSPEIQ